VTREEFDEVVLPHLDAGYRLARWLVRNDHDAQDVVQEASLRAFRYFGTFTGGNGRAWFLTLFVIHAAVSIVTDSTNRWTCSTSSITAIFDRLPVQRRCCFKQMT